MKTTIQKAQTKDIAVLNTISVAAKMYWNYPQEWLERWLPDLKLQASDFEQLSIWKLELETEIIGFCAIEEREAEYEVHHLWVLPDHIGKGYGKQLLIESLRLTMNSPKPIVVEADPNAAPFYERQGFITYAQKESYPEGRFLPLMRKVSHLPSFSKVN